MLAANPKIAPELRWAYGGETPPLLVESRLDDPLRLRKPALIGIQWMGDLFLDTVPFGFVERIFNVMKKAKQQTFQILTKRPGRMLEWWLWEEGQQCIAMHGDKWFPNVEFGVTVENQKTAGERRSAFRALPVSKKFVSYEPALGPVDWAGWEFITQLVFGGETGHGARPAHPDWFGNARDWAGEHGIARFFKAWGKWKPIHPFAPGDEWSQGEMPLNADGTDCRGHEALVDDTCWLMRRVGKKRAGRLLAGRAWDEMPKRRS